MKNLLIRFFLIVTLFLSSIDQRTKKHSKKFKDFKTLFPNFLKILSNNLALKVLLLLKSISIKPAQNKGNVLMPLFTSQLFYLLFLSFLVYQDTTLSAKKPIHLLPPADCPTSSAAFVKANDQTIERLKKANSDVYVSITMRFIDDPPAKLALDETLKFISKVRNPKAKYGQWETIENIDEIFNIVFSSPFTDIETLSLALKIIQEGNIDIRHISQYLETLMKSEAIVHLPLAQQLLDVLIHTKYPVKDRVQKLLTLANLHGEILEAIQEILKKEKKDITDHETIQKAIDAIKGN